mmetsp:Transcript_34877/g.49496  ORF Transcript_34877/g.49496 Transcript_34877/m.49496 type:complete len:370 (-) Transcript_34877:2-1111(-)
MTDSGDETPIPPMLQEDSEATLYKYRDFASVPEDPDNDPSPQQNNRSLESSIRVQKFPVKLYAILAQKEFSDIITWMPHGRSWKVLKPNLFESLVMPLFFEYSNYHSFNRLVNAWSFRRISSGPDRGSYYHELFLRGKPHLQKYMRRLPKTHKKLPMKKQDEPDFYKLDKASPLPDLDESATQLNSGVMAMARGGTNKMAGMNVMQNAMGGLNPSQGFNGMSGGGFNGMGGLGPGSMGGLGGGSGGAAGLMSGMGGLGGGMGGMAGLGGMGGLGSGPSGANGGFGGFCGSGGGGFGSLGNTGGMGGFTGSGAGGLGGMGGTGGGLSGLGGAGPGGLGGLGGMGSNGLSGMGGLGGAPGGLSGANNSTAR